mgnify:CR=1 FL=1
MTKRAIITELFSYMAVTGPVAKATKDLQAVVTTALLKLSVAELKALRDLELYCETH